ncbi:translational GTPase TypA [Candidatus Peregrinibacteria bacterium]|jgi:GTP-binding protein|nr:translational GTPase TypA [Candidatus Peregrinibacteria bacterium]MBT4148679.1 translational GTPase TypA [Candidatus Peregrinibacteria bacterium]MBT4366521.1 translational GTPase TypA [Candidatus Peregrinibacteria bacterium]MBT4456048.1 translational GTPase TypA [Candidatus Peregrinibacteria bacterium]
MDIYNVAIVAHVDHGKTTLVDALLKASEGFDTHKGLEERAMDSNDQEKERGITIYAKNAAITHKGKKLNIVDTPGHADFGSEVERVLRTVDAVILVVDAYEGPMPQTKFVLKKSLELGHKVLVVINKIDKPMARPDEVVDLTFDLFGTLGATDEQLDFPYMYAIAKQGIAIKQLDDEKKDIVPLIDFIFENVKPAESNIDAPFKMQPATLQYDNFVGRIALGRVYEGIIKPLQAVTVIDSDGERRPGKITKIFGFEGMERYEMEEARAGDIVAVAGLPGIYVGETITTDPEAEALPAIKVDPPALAIDFMVNDSPFAGREGKFVTSRHVKDRLEKELETNVGLKIEPVEGSDAIKVYGRGEMHIAVLIETMRREGFELQISQPEVIMQDIDGKKHEPIEYAVINLPDEIKGPVIEALGRRKGIMKNISSRNGNTTLEFEVPTRGLLGFRSAFLLMTRGEGTFYHSFDHYAPHVGEIEKRVVGSMISAETGATMAYSLWKLQERGPLFIGPATEIYEGMILGEHNQGTDLTVNPTKNKKLTNVRSSSSDESLSLTPITPMTLEQAIEYIKDDEYAEVTPTQIRLRKKSLTENDRRRDYSEKN